MIIFHFLIVILATTNILPRLAREQKQPPFPPDKGRWIVYSTTNIWYDASFFLVWNKVKLQYAVTLKPGWRGGDTAATNWLFSLQ